MTASVGPESRGPLLAIEGVVKRFGGHTALDEVSFAIAPGEIIALAGENGAGKSTLMAICSGALAPDGGALRWNGVPVRFASTAEARRAGIAIVHQEPQLVGCLSVAENLALGNLPRRRAGLVDWRKVDRTASDALNRVGLSLPLHAQVASLGPGVRQLVAIARAVHGGARLLILDEPTSSLSLHDADRLAAIVREVASQGTAVIYISHRIEELRPLAQRLVVLRDGRVTLDAPLPPCLRHSSGWRCRAGRRKRSRPRPVGSRRWPPERRHSTSMAWSCGTGSATSRCMSTPGRSSAWRGSSARAAPGCCTRSSAATRWTAAACACAAAARGAR